MKWLKWLINLLAGKKPMIQVAIWNQSSVLTDDVVRPMVAALQKQVSGHFAPTWGVDAELVFIGKDALPPQGAWQLVILDDTTDATALGFHDLTDEGLPLGKVFARTDIQGGYSWSVTTSHELLEMLLDPFVCYVVLSADGETEYALECGDPVEEDSLGYQIDGVLVSDFVLPPYFDGTPGKYDFQGHLTKGVPELMPGGYLSYRKISSGQGWQQSNARMKDAYQNRARVGSRRERRRTPRDQWLTSEPKGKL